MNEPDAPVTTIRPQLVTIEEAAPLLRTHPVTLRSHLRTGELPGIKIGHRWFMSSKVIDSLLLGERPVNRNAHPAPALLGIAGDDPHG